MKFCLRPMTAMGIQATIHKHCKGYGVGGVATLNMLASSDFEKKT